MPLLTPAAISLIVQGIQAVITEAPQIAQLVVQAKNFITGLFGAGVITKAMQDQLHAQVDAIQAAALAGQAPPAWTVEPDPAS